MVQYELQSWDAWETVSMFDESSGSPRKELDNFGDMRKMKGNYSTLIIKFNLKRHVNSAIAIVHLGRPFCSECGLHH